MRRRLSWKTPWKLAAVRSLEETAEGVQVHSLTVAPTGEVEETRDAVEELLQHTLDISPVWDVPGGENAP